jgi:hypothetical protein
MLLAKCREYDSEALIDVPGHSIDIVSEEPLTDEAKAEMVALVPKGFLIFFRVGRPNGVERAIIQTVAAVNGKVTLLKESRPRHLEIRIEGENIDQDKLWEFLCELLTKSGSYFDSWSTGDRTYDRRAAEALKANPCERKPVTAGDCKDVLIAVSAAKTVDDLLNDPYLFQQKG